MLDPTPPSIPPRPGPSRQEQNTPNTVPSIPARPKKNTKPTGNELLEDTVRKANQNEQDITMKSAHSEDISVSGGLSVSLESDEGSSADVLLEMVSDLNADSAVEDSPILESNPEIRNEKQVFAAKNGPAEPSALTSKSDFSDKSTGEPETATGPCTESGAQNSHRLIGSKMPERETHEGETGDLPQEACTTEACTTEAGTNETGTEGPRIPARPKKSSTKESLLSQNSFQGAPNASVVDSKENTGKILDVGDDIASPDLENPVSDKNFEEISPAEKVKSAPSSKNQIDENEEERIQAPSHETSMCDQSKCQSSVLENKPVLEEENNASKTDLRPAIPKRPTRTNTPKIPMRPAKEEILSLGEDAVKSKSEEHQEVSPSAKKAPPPKPKKLSSKIAAFQQMFNQAPLEQTQPKSSPTETGRLSGNHADFASNLQNIMGRGLPLPGMANPEMMRNLSNTNDSRESLPDESSDAPTEPVVPRRARGPRGKRLPKLIQETKIEIEPRFQVSATNLWEVKFTRKSNPRDVVCEEATNEPTNEPEQPKTEKEVLGGKDSGTFEVLQPDAFLQLDIEHSGTHMSLQSPSKDFVDVTTVDAAGSGSVRDTDESLYEDASTEDHFVAVKTPLKELAVSTNSTGGQMQLGNSESNPVTLTEEGLEFASDGSGYLDVHGANNDDEAAVIPLITDKCSKTSIATPAQVIPEKKNQGFTDKGGESASCVHRSL